MKVKISVIIPSFNSAKTLEWALKALDAQKARQLLSEVIVVDSSSDRETKDLLARYASGGVKIINSDLQTMPAVSRNAGASNARGVILAFIDADVYPSIDWLEKIAIACAEGYRAGGGGITIADFQRNKLIARAQYYLQFNEYIDAGKNRLKKFVPSCNMFCERKLFQELGGFPEIRAAEDVLFGLKVSKIIPMRFLPDAKVKHIFREDWKGFLRNQMLLGRYIIIYRKRYYKDYLAYKGPLPLVLFPGFLLVKLLRIIFRIAQAGRQHILRFIPAAPLFLVGLLFWSFGFLKGCFKR